MRQYHLYFESDQKYVVYDAKTKEITKIEYEEWFKLERKYELMKPFEPTEKGLKEFAEAFKQWIAELRNHKIYVTKRDCFNIDVLYNYKIKQIVKYIFERIVGDKIKEHQPIDPIETSYSDDCYNAGVMFLDEEYKNKYTKCFSYDYNNHYAKCMSSDKLMIPTKPGKEYKLKELPEHNKLKVGYYRVKITCKDKNFMKLFAFSEKNTYTDQSLRYAMILKEEKLFDIKIELNTEIKYNCYLYEDDDCVTGSYMFKKWYTLTDELKTKFPKNGIVKMICSSLHGYIMEKNTVNKTDEQVAIEKLDIGVLESNRYKVLDIKFYGKNQERIKYTLLDTKNPNHYNIRLKSFLTAFIRNKTARLSQGLLFIGKRKDENVIHDLNDVVRVCVDCVTFKIEQKHLNDNIDLKLEDKSTGKIYWVHHGKYYNKTDNTFHGKWNDKEKDISSCEEAQPSKKKNAGAKFFCE